MDESALLPQDVLSVQEDNETGELASDGYLIPFADVVDVYDWTSDIPFNQRTGIGHIDPQKFDRGQEEHSFTVEFPLQGAIDTSGDLSGDGDVNAPFVLEAIERLANRQLQKRAILWELEKPGEGVDSAGRSVWVVARHCRPDVLTLSGDPEENSPITVSLEYVSPKVRPYVLDQPGTATTLTVESSVTESGDVMISGVDDTDTETEVTVTVTDGSGTTTASFKEIYAVQLVGDFDGDVTVMDGSGSTYLTIYGVETYWGVEGDEGIPTTPDSGGKVTSHGGVEQRFLSNTVTWQGGAIAPEYNSLELEVNNNHETKNAAGNLGVEYRAGIRDITLSATVAGEKQSNEKVDVALRQLLGELVWNLDLNTITMANAAVSDPGSKVLNAEEAFASVDVEFTPKGIAVTTT